MRLLHYSDAPLGEIFSSDQRNSKAFKPRGLWVSVEGPDDWPSWCRSEEFGVERLTHVHEIELFPAANILRIQNAGGIDRFTDEFAIERDRFQGFKIDWPTIAERWQGIVIAPYIRSRRLSDHVSWYYGWDCASGCIWDASAIKSAKLLEVAK